MIESIETRLAHVRETITTACLRARRPPDSVTLIAVSKTHPVESILRAAAAGATHFGENRIEEAERIAVVKATYPTSVWHMIGHVQSRKAAEIVATYDWVHSLDSVKLAARYDRFAGERNHPLNVLLEINMSGEESKSGFAASQWRTDPAQREALWSAVREMSALSNLRIQGVMTMAPIVPDMEQTRPVFAGLRQLSEALRDSFPSSPWSVLSMGMTDDYPVAIEEGATHIRVGRAIFGDSPASP